MNSNKCCFLVLCSKDRLEKHESPKRSLKGMRENVNATFFSCFIFMNGMKVIKKFSFLFSSFLLFSFSKEVKKFYSNKTLRNKIYSHNDKQEKAAGKKIILNLNLFARVCSYVLDNAFFSNFNSFHMACKKNLVSSFAHTFVKIIKQKIITPKEIFF